MLRFDRDLLAKAMETEELSACIPVLPPGKSKADHTILARPARSLGITHSLTLATHNTPDFPDDMSLVNTLTKGVERALKSIEHKTDFTLEYAAGVIWSDYRKRNSHNLPNRVIW